jgi:heterodisulfide reductase subunit D
MQDQFEKCTECGTCDEVCPVYKITGEPLFSAMSRVKTAEMIFTGEEIDDTRKESIYNCPKCMQCESVCPEEIKITRLVHEARENLAKNGKGPLEKHGKIIKGIEKKDNSVGGDPEKRLNWLDEEFVQKKSDTLLYLGCIPAYLVKDAAHATYHVLKKLDFDFMMLEDEGCCYTYLYESGRTDLAKKYFTKNVERFSELGIKHIVVPCNGCLKCFKYFYPDLLGKMEFKVSHAVEVIYDLLKQKPDLLNKVEQAITYQDPCRLARGEKITEEPRELLKMCGAILEEAEQNRENAICCGAGAGIRSVFPELSIDIAESLLKSIDTKTIATTCPFCTFNLSYASKKKDLEKEIIYFTKIILDSLE